MKMLVKSAILAAAAFAAAAAASAQHGQLSVETSKTVPVRLSGSASSIVIGNKNVADVAVHSDSLIFVTGKSFGTTNLMVFDSAGREIYNTEVMVTTNSTNLVTINRAGQNFTYDCAPTCRPSLSLGDADDHFNALMQQQLQSQALTGGN